MKHTTISIAVIELDHYTELSLPDKLLVDEAFEATERAFAPYSQFKVGAAVRLTNGTIVTGNNQENASYPSGLCAERVALFYASSQFPGQAVDAIAVVAKTSLTELTNPVTPCGSCRQVMAEYEQLNGQKIRVIMASPSGKTMIVEGIAALLPLAFQADYLKKIKTN
ncbi:MAG: cytidine deaminase [Bacteroidales bacterium]|nr:cytidine deaminase [Bacteroidales bacterium]MDZ4203960.1 cytidine deaminase [Bacteroidales bacterium]